MLLLIMMNMMLRLFLNVIHLLIVWMNKRYLNKRRYVTKAKFDVYFSIRTSAEQFNERRDILKSVPWENYTFIQSSLAKLGEL